MAEVDFDDDERAVLDRAPFLMTHRALAACTREFGRLADHVMRGASALAAADGQSKPEIRLAPERCIVQLGPVALTLAWLRSTRDTAADGQLLAIVWHGAVAPRGEHSPERTDNRRLARTATAVWEEVLVASGESEAAWLWQPTNAKNGGYSSADLAARCLERLSAAYAEHKPETV